MHYRWKYVFMVLPLLFFVSCGKGPDKKQPVPSGKKIRIGVIGPMTGPDKSKGKHGLRGIKTAMSLYPLLSNGDAIELVVKDDKDDPELSVKALKDLVEKDKVSSILVLSSSHPTLCIDDEADDYKTPILALIASHPDISEKTHYVHQLCFDNEFQGKIAALYARDELLVTHAAVLVNQYNPHSKSLGEIFTDKFKKTGGTISETIRIVPDMGNLTYKLKELQKSNTELLYMPVNPEDFLNISKILKELNWNVPRMGSDGLLSTVFTRYRPDLHVLEGVVGIDFYSANVPLTDHGEDFIKEYRKLYRTQANTYTIAGMEGYAILFNALNKCKYVDDKSEINQKIGETVDFEGAMARITIQPNGKAIRPLFVNTVKKGKLIFLVKVY